MAFAVPGGTRAEKRVYKQLLQRAGIDPSPHIAGGTGGKKARWSGPMREHYQWHLKIKKNNIGRQRINLENGPPIDWKVAPSTTTPMVKRKSREERKSRDARKFRKCRPSSRWRHCPTCSKTLKDAYELMYTPANWLMRMMGTGSVSFQKCVWRQTTNISDALWSAWPVNYQNSPWWLMCFRDFGWRATQKFGPLIKYHFVLVAMSSMTFQGAAPPRRERRNKPEYVLNIIS